MTDTYMLDQARQDLANVEADRDRARTIAVHLEQEVAMLTTERHRFAEDYAELAAEHARALRTANVYGSVLEQVGLLQEHYAAGPDPDPQYWDIAEHLQRILDGATFAEVRDA